MKSGAFRGGPIAEQLQSDQDVADGRLPTGLGFTFILVLASRRGVPRERLKALRH